MRKGKKLTDNMAREIKKPGLPNWYADYCNSIVYMFPRAHAAGYVVQSLRLAWFKLYHPEAFYTAYFEVYHESVTAADFREDETLLRKAILKIRSDEVPNSPESWQHYAKKERRGEALELLLEMKARGILCPVPENAAPDIPEEDDDIF